MNRLPSIRRWGVAALTGVTLFGGLSLVGAGVASAATPTVSAALVPGQTASTIAGTVTPITKNAADFILTVNGPVAKGDQITLTLGCPSTGTAVFTAAPTLTSSGTAAWAAGTPTLNTAGCSVETLTAGAADTAASGTVTVSNNEITTKDVSSQALAITGTYATLGLAATSFTVPTIANVLWYTISSNIPAVTLPATSASTGTAVSQITVNQPQGIATGIALGDNITLTAPTGDAWVTTGTPTLTTSGGFSNGKVTVTSSTVVTVTFPTTGTPTPTVPNTATQGGTFTVSGLALVTTSPGSKFGPQNATLADATTTTEISASVNVGTIFGSATTIAGADGTADGTVAAEFEAAFPNGNNSVVLATDTPMTNGSDALAASYLEGQLGTGLLITPSTTLGADAQLAMRLEGVKTVYVVGGPLAVSPAVIAQVAALPAYNTGGLVKTGSNITVINSIYGADGTAVGTAAAIATYFGQSYSATNLSAAYTAGAYNTTTGSQSTTAPTTSLRTAIVVASSDWQDAMSVAPLAYAEKWPVILNGPSTDTTLSTTAQGALTTLGVQQVIVIGGQLALQNSVEAQIQALNGGISVLRIAGIDATDTAAQIANFALNTTANAGLGWTTDTVLASHADYWSDALGAAALGGTKTQPIILVQNPTTVGQYTTAELPVLGKLGVFNLTVLGGPLAMPSSTVQTLLNGL